MPEPRSLRAAANEVFDIADALIVRCAIEPEECPHEDAHLEYGRGLICDACDEQVEPRK